MTQSQIKCFLTAAESCSFSKAAESLFISQPAVSKQVAQLEAEFGVALFERTQNGLVITKAGELACRFFNRIQKEYREMLAEAHRLSETPTSALRIGCLEGWNIDRFYPRIRERFSAKYPDLELSIRGFGKEALIAALKSEQVDVIITYMNSMGDHPEIPCRHLTDLDAVVMYTPRHPLAGRANLTIGDFRDSTFYTADTPGDSRGARLFGSFFAALNGYEPQIECLGNLHAVMFKLLNGEGVFVADSWLMAAEYPAMHSIPADFSYEVGIGWLDRCGVDIKNAFVGECVSMFRRQSQDNGEKSGANGATRNGIAGKTTSETRKRVEEEISTFVGISPPRY